MSLLFKRANAVSRRLAVTGQGAPRASVRGRQQPAWPPVGPGVPCSYRGIIGPANIPAGGALEYPEGSMSQQLLDRCLEAAVARGVDVASPYKPWIPVDLMQTLILDVHEAVGCSWALAIVVACLGIRVVTLPISIAAIRGAREKAIIQPLFAELTEKQKKLSLEGDQAKVAQVSKQIQEFTQKHGKFFMLKGTWNLFCFQVPLYITAFAAMRGFASHPDIFRGFAMESPLWLDSLALADPYALLPLFTTAIMLTNTELFGSIDTEVAATAPVVAQNVSSAVGGQSTFQKYQKWIMRGSALLFLPMTWNFPAGVFIFMSTNMIASTLQNRVLRLPVLERLLEIPPPPERTAEASAKLARAGPLALTPLVEMLRQIHAYRKPRGIAAAPGPLKLPQLELGASFETERPKRPVAKAPRSPLDLQVSPEFAVRRTQAIRPAPHAA